MILVDTFGRYFLSILSESCVYQHAGFGIFFLLEFPVELVGDGYPFRILVPQFAPIPVVHIAVDVDYEIFLQFGTAVCEYPCVSCQEFAQAGLGETPVFSAISVVIFVGPLALLQFLAVCCFDVAHLFLRFRNLFWNSKF